MENKIVDVWDDSQLTWVEYSIDELNEYFHFESKPNFSNIREMYLHNGGYQNWLEIIFNNGRKIYNNVFGTYVES